MDHAFEYVIKNNGIDTESSYPYTAVNGKQCKYSADNKGATISSFKDIPRNSEDVRIFLSSSFNYSSIYFRT